MQAASWCMATNMKRAAWALALGLAAAGLLVFAGCRGGQGSSDENTVAAAPWPAWVFEHWAWSDPTSQDQIMQLVEDYEARDLPVGAVVISSPWATGYNTFQFDPALYPDAPGMIDWLHQRGVRVILWVNPVINVACAAGDTTCPEQDLYNQGNASHFFMGDGMPIPWPKSPSAGALIDYFNPQALEWWHSLMDPILDMGIDGWKCDTIEPFSLFVSVSPYAGPVKPWAHNDRYYQDFFDYTRRRLGPDRVIMARPVEYLDLSGIVGQPVMLAFPYARREINFAGWVGEQDPTFEGLQTAMVNIYLSADIGYLAPGSDIGGYKDGPRDQETFLRWAQFGAMCPLMENGGKGEHRPWMIGGDTVERQDTLEIYRQYLDLHYQLIPYMTRQAALAWARGKSIINLVKNDADIWTWEYTLGPDLLVAPIHEPGATRTVTFPAGNDWVYLWDRSQVHAGGAEAALDFPLDEYPVFIRQGSPLETLL
ncbi:MAG TPA: TIM-barrel domain-containing protein [bacterium]|nr:TIM-barrel domain-containing protein [bacterium]